MITRARPDGEFGQMVVKLCLACFWFFSRSPAHCLPAEADGLIGTWKLVSWQVIVKNRPPQNVFGEHPKGFLILTREGRGIVVTTAENSQAGMGDSDKTALHKSMLAYSGIPDRGQ